MNGRAYVFLLLVSATTTACRTTETVTADTFPLPERFAPAGTTEAGRPDDRAGKPEAVEVSGADPARRAGSPRAEGSVRPASATELVDGEAAPSETGATKSPDVAGRDVLPAPPDVVAEPVRRELPEIPPPPGADRLAFGPDRPLTLDDVVASMIETYPLTEAALWERAVYEGKTVEALGAWDSKVKGEHMAQPLGFYENYRTAVGVEQPWYGGGYSTFRYRVGDGHFEPWYKERETDEGGEFEAGIGVPLWRDRTIDEWRAELWTARVDRQAVEPEIQARLIDFSYQASVAYWTWVEAGQQYLVQKRLLELIRGRTLQMEERFRRQDVAEIELIDNDRGLAKREEKLIASERKLQSAALELSLFLRTAEGEPIVPPFEWLPKAFPTRPALNAAATEEDVRIALARRPELRSIAFDVERQRIEIAQAENLALPSVSGVVLASQDVGARATPLGDKKPFELEAGLAVDLPIQRRKAAGRMQAARARLLSLERQRQFTEDRIAAEVRDAVSAMAAAAERAERAGRNRDRSEELVELERFALVNGDSTLFKLNLREQDLIDSETLFYETLGDFFRAEAAYRASLGENELSP